MTENLKSLCERAMENITHLMKEVEESDRISLLMYSVGAGDAPSFTAPVTSDEIVAALARVSSLYTQEGNPRIKNPLLENYGICLWKDGHYGEAVRVFDALTEEGIEPLGEGRCRLGYYDPTKNTAGKLGYEGALAYARSCLEVGREERAIEVLSMFRFLEESVDEEIYPIRAGDVRDAALRILMEKGIIEEEEWKAAHDATW